MKANMPARNQFLLDRRRRCAEIFDRVEDLLRRGDVVRFAGKEVDGTDDVFEIETPTEPDKVALGQPVLLEQLDDGLEIPPARQVDRVLVPALERLLLFQIKRRSN